MVRQMQLLKLFSKVRHMSLDFCHFLRAWLNLLFLASCTKEMKIDSHLKSKVFNCYIVCIYRCLNSLDELHRTHKHAKKIFQLFLLKHEFVETVQEESKPTAAEEEEELALDRILYYKKYDTVIQELLLINWIKIIYFKNW